MYYKSCLHHITPYARETESARCLPRCSLELLETTRNAVACLESASIIHATLGMYDSLGFIVLLCVVTKVNPDCSLAPGTFQALDPYLSQLQGPRYFRYLMRAFWGLAEALNRIYSRKSSWSSCRLRNHRMGAASGHAACKDSS